MKDTIIISKKGKKIISEIFEHNDEVYSIYFKDNRDVVWIQGKVELYNYINKLFD